MTHDADLLASELRAWIDRGLHARDGANIAARLLALCGADFTSFATDYPDEISIATVRSMATRAHGLLAADPQAALLLAQVAMRVAIYVQQPEANRDAVVEAEADAWKVYAQALLELGRFAEAEAPAETAQTIYSAAGLRHKEAIMGLIRGEIIHCRGHWEEGNRHRLNEGLRMVERSANLLLGLFGDKRGYVQGRFIYAKLLIVEQRYNDAHKVYLHTTDLLEDLGDRELKAHALNSTGMCYKHMGRLQEAISCVSTAQRIFESMGSRTDALRARWEVANILTYSGRYHEAINELFITHNGFLEVGIPVEAARVGLTIVEILPLAGRATQVAPLCAKLIDVFRRAKIQRKVIEALAHMHASAQSRGYVTDEELQAVRGMLDAISPVCDQTAV